MIPIISDNNCNNDNNKKRIATIRNTMMFLQINIKVINKKPKGNFNSNNNSDNNKFNNGGNNNNNNNNIIIIMIIIKIIVIIIHLTMKVT